jgi:hypothetical protein
MVQEKVLETIAKAVLVTVLAVSPAVGLSRKPPEPAHVPGQIVVIFHESVDSARSTEIIETEGARIKTILKRTGLHLILLPDGMEVEKAVERFRGYPEVLSAEPNYRAQRLEDQ